MNEETVTTKDGVKHDMEHVDYTDNSSEDVAKNSILIHLHQTMIQ